VASFIIDIFLRIANTVFFYLEMISLIAISDVHTNLQGKPPLLAGPSKVGTSKDMMI
jgi:hypothetical protein